MENAPLQERVGKFVAEQGALLTKYGLKISFQIDFPQYKILPEEVQLAVKVILKHGAEYGINYQEAPKKEEPQDANPQ